VKLVIEHGTDQPSSFLLNQCTFTTELGGFTIELEEQKWSKKWSFIKETRVVAKVA